MNKRIEFNAILAEECKKAEKSSQEAAQSWDKVAKIRELLAELSDGAERDQFMHGAEKARKTAAVIRRAMTEQVGS